ncbi:nitronate monooxygenase [Aliamphritea spongicola]|nr:nitronate monooxygenase [Aliamphritea spongicola]
MTDIRDLFDIELPVIQAPMAGVQGSALAVAVSNAGGLGSLPCAMLTPEVMATELEAIRAGTDLPVNVNFLPTTLYRSPIASYSTGGRGCSPITMSLELTKSRLPVAVRRLMLIMLLCWKRTGRKW